MPTYCVYHYEARPSGWLSEYSTTRERIPTDLPAHVTRREDALSFCHAELGQPRIVLITREDASRPPSCWPFTSTRTKLL